MPDVQFADPARCTIFAHMLKSVIARSAPHDRFATIVITISGVSTTIEFVGERIVLREGIAARYDAALESDAATLASLARGGSLIVAWLRGRLRLRGNPLRLLPLLPLLRPRGPDKRP
ncbi:MAG: hypothetical protein HY719_12065 [Planctomycetes bacterium]|nr:hypothetical protein [Planctomycetota bacterium]